MTCTSRLTVETLRVPSFTSDVYQLAIGDFDRDGVVDMFAPTSPEVRAELGLGFPSATTNPGTVLLGRGDGTFTTGATYVTRSESSTLVVASGDFDGDQILDLATGSAANDSLTAPADRVAIDVRLGNGDGTFGPVLAVRAPTLPSFITTGDLDGDGVLDLVTLAGASPVITIHRGHGDGTFGNRQELPLGGVPVAVTVTDWNRDGVADLIANEDYLHVLLGTGNGSFAPALDCGLVLHGFGVRPRMLVLADFDRDGMLDLVADNTVLFGMQGCSFSHSTSFRMEQDTALPLAAADLNGDGAVDLAVAHHTGIGFLPGDGRGNFGAVVMLDDLDVERGVPDSNAAMVVDANGDGRLDLVVGSRYHVRVFVNTCD